MEVRKPPPTSRRTGPKAPTHIQHRPVRFVIVHPFILLCDNDRVTILARYATDIVHSYVLFIFIYRIKLFNDFESCSTFGTISICISDQKNQRDRKQKKRAKKSPDSRRVNTDICPSTRRALVLGFVCICSYHLTRRTPTFTGGGTRYRGR